MDWDGAAVGPCRVILASLSLLRHRLTVPHLCHSLLSQEGGPTFSADGCRLGCACEFIVQHNHEPEAAAHAARQISRHLHLRMLTIITSEAVYIIEWLTKLLVIQCNLTEKVHLLSNLLSLICNHAR